MKVTIRHTEEGDADQLKGFHEVGNSMELLKGAIADSLECWSGLIDDEVIAIWGVTAPNVLSDDVYVWLTAGRLVELHPITFARWSHEALKTLSAYPKLHGLVLCDFEISKKWLRWLGFEVGVAEGQVCKFARGTTEAAVAT